MPVWASEMHKYIWQTLWQSSSLQSYWILDMWQSTFSELTNNSSSSRETWKARSGKIIKSATSILVPFYWQNTIHVNMDLCLAINNLEPDLSLPSFPSSVLMWRQTLGVGRLLLFLASGAALYVHLHQRAAGTCCADLGSISSGATEPHCAW